MDENELREFIKGETNRTIDEVYEKISNARELKPESRYNINISIKNPITDEVLNQKVTLDGNQMITIRNFINKNRVKSNAIRRLLKRELWKLIYRGIKEEVFTEK